MSQAKRKEFAVGSKPRLHPASRLFSFGLSGQGQLRLSFPLAVITCEAQNSGSSLNSLNNTGDRRNLERFFCAFLKLSHAVPDNMGQHHQQNVRGACGRCDVLGGGSGRCRKAQKMNMLPSAPQDSSTWYSTTGLPRSSLKPEQTLLCLFCEELLPYGTSEAENTL